MLSALTSGAQSKFYQNAVVHTIVTALLFIIPYILTHTAVDTITIGSLLRGISQWLETRTA